MKRQIEIWSEDKEMTTKEMYKMFKDYHVLKRANKILEKLLSGF